MEDNLAALRILEEENGVQDDAVKAARKSVDLTTSQYKAGTVSYLNVITVQTIALTDQVTCPVTVLLTAGQAGDNPQLIALLDAYGTARTAAGTGKDSFQLLADKAYSHPSTQQRLRERRIPHTIPERSDQKKRRKAKGSHGGRPPAFDNEIYANATRSNAASTGSSNGAASPPATTNTPNHRTEDDPVHPEEGRLALRGQGIGHRGHRARPGNRRIADQLRRVRRTVHLGRGGRNERHQWRPVHGAHESGEEEQKVTPAIEECRADGIDVYGPLPADTVFFRVVRGDFDLVVAMYHDQGHGPVKVLGLDAGVNITIGLPVIRTSVDHGTAFDIGSRAGNAVPSGTANCPRS